jgi:hypothetical protein
VAASGRDFERALGAFLALDVGEVDSDASCLEDFWLRPREHLRALEVVGKLDERGRRDDLDLGARPRGFRPHAAGQIKPSPRALAPMAAGRTPATAAIEPSRPSSPNTANPESASWGMAPIAAISPSAIGRS